MDKIDCGRSWRFLSTLSLRRATKALVILPKEFNHFYPRSPCGERQTKLDRTTGRITFLSTLSLRRATDVIAVITDAQSISIHALLAESDNLRVVDGSKSSVISIHALLAESDNNKHGQEQKTNKISIHALLAESDFITSVLLKFGKLFLSTLSLRRATPERVCT